MSYTTDQLAKWKNAIENESMGDVLNAMLAIAKTGDKDDQRQLKLPPNDNYNSRLYTSIMSHFCPPKWRLQCDNGQTGDKTEETYEQGKQNIQSGRQGRDG